MGNHSDDSGHVSLKTTRRGNGAQVTGAKGKKMAGETCNEGGVVAKRKLSRLENTRYEKKKKDIRNWLNKEKQLKKENIPQIKSEEDMVYEAEIIDLSEDITPLKVSEAEIIDLLKEIRSSTSKEEKMTLHGKEKVGAEIIDLRKVGAGSSRQGKKMVDIQRGPLDEYLNKRLPLKRRDLQTLSGSEFLNDEIINKYLTLILERNEADASLPEIYTCTTFMYTPTGIPTHTESWIKEDLRRKDQIIFPIHMALEVHWSLIVVETRTKTVNYFDSLERTRIFHMSPVTIKKFMEEYYKDRGETVIFRIQRRKDAHLQDNGYDCGVFLCQNAERITRKSSMNFSQRDLDLACAS